MSSPKRHFIGKQGPPGYVAGIGRGATGFTTRSDIGPAREAANMAAAAAMANTSRVVGTTDDGQARKALKKSSKDDEDDEDQYLNDSNYDEFAGYGGSLFNKDPYEEDDEEADKTWEAIDKRMEERRKKQREIKARQDLEKYRDERPKVKQQFSDLKADLMKVSESEWMSIPEVGDARNRKQRVARQDKFTPVPDSILAHQARLASGGERLLFLDPKATDPDAMDTDDAFESGHENSPLAIAARGQPPTADGTGVLNIGEMSDFRSSYMSMKLSGAATAVDGQTSTNPQDYLTNLQAMVSTQINEESTVNEYRRQFAALRASNPSFPNAWIASVRLEEAAGKLRAARSLVLAACEKCPKSADLWCEAVRLHPPEVARALMIKALKEVPRSVKLWCKAAELEQDDVSRRKVYAKAREILPKSVLLWKKSAELEGPDEARMILRDAVECCPESVEFWLALARLEPYEEASKALCKASDINPTEKSIWIMAAKLEEAAGHEDKVAETLRRFSEKLGGHRMAINKDEWFKEAMDAEKANFKVTCREIIKVTIGLDEGDSVTTINQQQLSKPAILNATSLMDSSKGKLNRITTIENKRLIDDNDNDKQLKRILNDAQKFVASGSIECARAVYEIIIEDSRWSKMELVWLSYADFERKNGDPAKLESVLRRSIGEQNCRRSENLWLMLANEKRAHLAERGQILWDALNAKPDSERIVLAIVELECENGNHKVARKILADACMAAKTAQLIMRSAKLEWDLGNLDEAVRFLKSGVEEHKSHADFYLSLGQLEEQRDRLEQAKAHYSAGLKFCPTSVELWIAIAKLEERTGSLARARSKLQTATLRNPKVPQLYLEAARLEMRVHEAKQNKQPGSRPAIVTTLLAKGIKECKDHPDVSLLHAEQAKWKGRKIGGI